MNNNLAHSLPSLDRVVRTEARIHNPTRGASNLAANSGVSYWSRTCTLWNNSPGSLGSLRAGGNKSVDCSSADLTKARARAGNDTGRLALSSELIDARHSIGNLIWSAIQQLGGRWDVERTLAGA